MTSPTLNPRPTISQQASAAARVLERFDRIRDGLSEAGYCPIDCLDLPDSKATATTEYYELRGWDAVRHNGDTLSFARFGDEGSRLMTTSLSGVIHSEASFSDDEHGARMFVDAARSFPGEVEERETTQGAPMNVEQLGHVAAAIVAASDALAYTETEDTRYEAEIAILVASAADLTLHEAREFLTTHPVDADYALDEIDLELDRRSHEAEQR